MDHSVAGLNKGTGQLLLPFLRVCSWPFLVLYSNTNTRIWQFSPKKIYKRPSAPVSTTKILFAAITYCRHFNLMVHLISGHGPQVIYCPSDFILLTSLPQTHFPCYGNSKLPLQFLPKNVYQLVTERISPLLLERPVRQLARFVHLCPCPCSRLYNLLLACLQLQSLYFPS